MTSIPRRWRRRAIFAGTVAAALATSAIVAVTASAADDIEHIQGGDFSAGSGAWYGYGGSGSASAATGALCYSPNPGGNPWDAGIGLNGLALRPGGEYTLQLDITSTVDYSINVNVQLDADPYTQATSAQVNATSTATHLTRTFTWTADHTAGIAIQVGGASAAAEVCIDNVSLVGPAAAANQIVNGTFDSDTAPWWSTGNTPVSVVDGQLCGPVPAGGDPWNSIIGQDNVALVSGETYTFSFTASASAPTVVRALIQHPTTFATQIDEHPALTAAPQSFSYTFTSNADLPNGQVAFQLGGGAVPYTICLDDISLIGGAAPPVYTPETGPRVRVNQVGYLPKGPKNATVVTDATEPLAWQLKNGGGAVVATGDATPRGVDATSGQNVQSIDFSSFTGSGTGFTLVADGETSHPFDISGTIYNSLRLDALKFYYTQRSGIEILDSLRPGYARAAGHLGVAPNQGDISVPCQPGVCDYSLDVRGGWYDAGDHGKYVVNGGISVYGLMSEYERTKVAATAKPGALGDSTLALPESGNGVPDILDEARWELEFLLSMQVPADKPLAGMVHHKIHDENWTGLPLMPANDPQKRELHKPSTAATLNLAATAAQAARVFAPYDAAFAAKALAAARTAYAAAKANPAIYALVTDGTGGGAYDDNDVSDEFYWAAAELYITTGEKQFADAVIASPHHTSEIFRADGFDWKWTGAAGRLDLATLPNNLPGRAAVRASVVAGADAYLAALDAHPYGIAYAPASGKFDWGSNALIANNLVVMATAYDISGAAKYRDGVLEGMDYLLGRNALNYSYITGYGEQASENQHSRWYAKSLNTALPNPPVGSLAGGPNSSIQDPKAQSILQGCAPQFCYVDHIDSWSTNEITINWNAALAWVAAFVADQGDASPPAPASCKVSYSAAGVLGVVGGIVKITNTGNATVDGWTLSWSYLGNTKVQTGIGATITQSGPTVTAKNQALNKKIRKGQSVSFGFLGTGTGPLVDPALFILNGKPCTS